MIFRSAFRIYRSHRRTAVQSLARPRSTQRIRNRRWASAIVALSAAVAVARLDAPVAGSRSSQATLLGVIGASNCAAATARLGDRARFAALAAQVRKRAAADRDIASHGRFTAAASNIPPVRGARRLRRTIASPSPIRPVTFSTSFMKRLRREPLKRSALAAIGCRRKRALEGEHREHSLDGALGNKVDDLPGF